MSYADQLQRVVRQYQQAGEPWPASARDIARWAIDQGLWKPQPKDLVGRCAEEISRAMAEEYIRDAQGRMVRAKHAARILIDGEQQTLWADIRTAELEHMRTAFAQRRQHIVGECRQLKADVDSYNENAQPKDPIQLVLDFTLDVEEAEAAERLAAE